MIVMVMPSLQEMPIPVATLLYGSLGPVYIAEAVSACRETGQSIPLIVDMLAQVKKAFFFIFCSFGLLIKILIFETQIFAFLGVFLLQELLSASVGGGDLHHC